MSKRLQKRQAQRDAILSALEKYGDLSDAVLARVITEDTRGAIIISQRRIYGILHDLEREGAIESYKALPRADGRATPVYTMTGETNA